MTKEGFNYSLQKEREISPCNGAIVIKVDFDRTLVESKYPHGLGPLKIPQGPMEESAGGIRFLANQEDIIFGGISTARVKYVQSYTHRQVMNRFGDLDIRYTNRSFRRKITDILHFAQAQNESIPIYRTVLIDEDVAKIHDASHALDQNRQYKALMRKYGFTYVAFNPEQSVAPASFPDSMRDVIELNNWSTDSVSELLTRLRD